MIWLVAVVAGRRFLSPIFTLIVGKAAVGSTSAFMGFEDAFFVFKRPSQAHSPMINLAGGRGGWAVVPLSSISAKTPPSPRTAERSWHLPLHAGYKLHPAFQTTAIPTTPLNIFAPDSSRVLAGGRGEYPRVPLHPGKGHRRWWEIAWYGEELGSWVSGLFG